MSEVLAWEIDFVIRSFLVGLLIGGGYDALRGIRRILRHPYWLVSLQDVFFCVIAGLVVFLLFYRCNNGVWRGFSLVTIALGLLAWRMGPGRLFLWFFPHFFWKSQKKKKKKD